MLVGVVFIRPNKYHIVPTPLWLPVRIFIDSKLHKVRSINIDTENL